LPFSSIDFSDKHVHVKFADASNKNKKLYKTGFDVSSLVYEKGKIAARFLRSGYEEWPSVVLNGSDRLVFVAGGGLSSMVTDVCGANASSTSFKSATTAAATSNYCLRSTTAWTPPCTSSHVCASRSTSAAIGHV
jgi:hypothetical protein